MKYDCFNSKMAVQCWSKLKASRRLRAKHGSILRVKLWQVEFKMTTWQQLTSSPVLADWREDVDWTPGESASSWGGGDVRVREVCQQCLNCVTLHHHHLNLHHLQRTLQGEDCQGRTSCTVPWTAPWSRPGLREGSSCSHSGGTYVRFWWKAILYQPPLSSYLVCPSSPSWGAPGSPACAR